MSLLEGIVILVCLAGNAFFAGIETGVISIHRMRLRHVVRQGMPGARMLQGFLVNSDRLLGTTLVGTNLNMVVLSVLTAGVAARFFGPGGKTAAAVVVSLTVLVFCEYLPKAWFHGRPLERSRRFVWLLRVTEVLLWPLSWVVVLVSRLLAPGMAGSFSKPAPFVTREDLKALARDGEREGVLSPRERFMIHRVIELAGKRAGEIMVPRDRMTAVTADTTVAEFRRITLASGYTRMPVFDPAAHAYCGVVNIFFVLAGQAVDPARTVREFMRPVLFVSESTPVDDILGRMRRSRQPMCLVRNAAGAVSGLVTTEDILEEVVGAL